MPHDDSVSSELTATVRTTEYVVSVFPDGFSHEAHHWAIRVCYRGDGLWALVNGGSCYGLDGSWDYESIPSERRDEWLATHRFLEAEALELAKELAPKMIVNGYTVDDVVARYAEWAASEVVSGE